MLPSIAVCIAALYVSAYWLLLTPTASLYASKSGVMRMRQARYRFRNKLVDYMFAPMNFADFLFREDYWIQKDAEALLHEDHEWASNVSAIEQIGKLGGLLIWDGDGISVSFLGRPIDDDDLIVFKDFPLVDDLDVANSGITDAGFRHLKELIRLRHLDVTGTQITDDEIARFRMAIPDCFVWNDK